MAPSPVTDAERAKIIDDIKAGGSCGGIAAKYCRSKSTVSRIARDEGLHFTRPGLEAATRAKKLDNAAKRALLEAGMLDDALKLRGQLFAPTVAFNFGGKDNTYASTALAEPTFVDKRNITQAVKTLADGAANIAKIDADGGLDEALGLLGRFGQALGLLPATSTDPDGG